MATMHEQSMDDYTGQLRHVFDMCDTEQKGEISVDLLVELARKYFPGDDWESSQESITNIIKGLDLEENGILNFSEFCEWVKRIVEHQDRRKSIRRDSLHSVDHTDDSSTYETSEMSTYSDYDVTDEVFKPILMGMSDVKQRTKRLTPDMSFDSGIGKINDHVKINDNWPSNFDEEVQAQEFFSDMRSSSSSPPPTLKENLTPWISHIVTPQRPQSPRMQAHGSKSNTPRSVAARLLRDVSPNRSRRSSMSGSPPGLYDDTDGCIYDLNDKVKKLENQIQELSETQLQSNERQLKMKEENSRLIERVHLLEETIREIDSRAQEQLSEEQKKYKELITRRDNEKSREIEILTQSLQRVERDYEQLKKDAPASKSENEKLRRENAQLERELSRLQEEFSDLSEERTKWHDQLHEEQARSAQDRRINTQLIDELSKELAELRAYRAESQQRSPYKTEEMPRSARRELESHISLLKEDNAKLRERCEDLHAQLIGRDALKGRSLLLESEPSLASEFEQLSRDELMDAVKKEQESNRKLREYVEQITLRILDCSPSILEISAQKK